MMKTLIQLKREHRANESKENQGKSLAFPWIPLAESGLFNALERIQIKKFSSAPTRLSGCGTESSNPFSRSIPPVAEPASGGGLVRLMGRDITHISVLEKPLHFFPVGIRSVRKSVG
jgi:hypothetical protein